MESALSAISDQTDHLLSLQYSLPYRRANKKSNLDSRWSHEIRLFRRPSTLRLTCSSMRCKFRNERSWRIDSPGSRFPPNCEPSSTIHGNAWMQFTATPVTPSLSPSPRAHWCRVALSRSPGPPELVTSSDLSVLKLQIAS